MFFELFIKNIKKTANAKQKFAFEVRITIVDVDFNYYLQYYNNILLV